MAESADADGVSYLSTSRRATASRAVHGGRLRGCRITVSRDGAPILGTPLEPMPDPAMCGGMVEVTGFTFEAGAHYLFELGPTAAPALRLSSTTSPRSATNGAIDASIDVLRSPPRCWPHRAPRAPAIAPTRASASSAHR